MTIHPSTSFSQGFFLRGSFSCWSLPWHPPSTPTPPLQIGLKCEKPSFIYWAINLQQYLQGFLHFHYQQDLFICFSKWLCCYRLFSESLSLPQGWSRQFQQLCFPFGTVRSSGARWLLIEGLRVLIAGGIKNDQTLEKKNKKTKTTAWFRSSVSVINVS